MSGDETYKKALDTLQRTIRESDELEFAEEIERYRFWCQYSGEMMNHRLLGKELRRAKVVARTVAERCARSENDASVLTNVLSRYGEIVNALSETIIELDGEGETAPFDVAKSVITMLVDELTGGFRGETMRPEDLPPMEEMPAWVRYARELSRFIGDDVSPSELVKAYEALSEMRRKG